MKTIGLIGGISWQSTLVYYKILNETVAAKLGDTYSCKCIIQSLQFNEVKRLQNLNDWNSLNTLVADTAMALEKGGANLLMIGANTMHLTAPFVAKKINIPLVHIVDVVGRQIVKLNIKKVALIGTHFTMKEPFYKIHLNEKFEIEVSTPTGADFDCINDIIFNELVKGIFSAASKQKYQQIMEKLMSQGAEGIILGCTEIPLLINQKDCAYPVFDTTKLHAEAAVDAALF